MKNHISFDLDGTIIASKQSVMASMIASLRNLGIDEKKISSVGPSLNEMILALGMENLSDAQKIREEFIYQYDKNFCLDTKLYPNIESTLQKLLDENNFLTLVTNKRTIPTMKILKKFNIDSFFSRIICIDTSNKLRTKPQILKSLYLPEVKNYYIGDLDGDYIAAKDAGYQFLYASWGYGDITDVISLNSPNEILKYLSLK